MVQAVAKISGAKPADVPAGLALYRFPTCRGAGLDRLAWRRQEGGAASALADTSAFLKEQGTIQEVLPDYARP